jgi:hypothetical protein
MNQAMKRLSLFCAVDDFCKVFIPRWNRTLVQYGVIKRIREPQLSISEIMTIIIHFHQSHYRDFKTYYIECVCEHLGDEFPNLVSYNRFIELMPRVLLPLCCYLNSCKGENSGISFVDSTRIVLCGNKRISRNKVFKDIAKLGKSTLGWFFGFKLHLVVNDQGELLAFCLTPGNTDDRKPVPEMTKGMFGKLFGDKGYISQSLFEQLFEAGLQLVTGIRKNMKNQLVPLMDKLLSRKRSIIETINDQLKNISQIEHTRHRSVTNCMVNIIAGLIAYSHQEKKPSLNLADLDLDPNNALVVL